MRLDGKVALITGAGRGIGRATALRLAGEGADIVVNDLIAANAANVAAEVEALGRKAIAIPADVTNSRQIKEMVDQAVAHFGKIDVLVNNAGYSVDALFMDTDEADWDKFLNIDLKSVFICSKAVLAHMIPRASGRIVCIASDAGRGGISGEAVYSAAKGGVIAFGKSLAREMARYKINVNVVAPGVVDTDMARGVMEAGGKRVEGMIKAIPFRRIAQPEEIAAAVAFLASDDAQYITGQTLSVNGGLIMP